MFKLVSRGPTSPPEPWKWTVHFYWDEDVIEFGGSYFQAGTYFGGRRKWAPVIPSEDGWTAAEWDRPSQSWVPKVFIGGGFIPFSAKGWDRG